MTPLQELCNAVTIVPPGALLVCAHWRRRPLLALAGALQTPAAFAYHASVARLGHRIDNDLRRLDQTMQHIAAVCLTYELSGCAVAYTLLAAAYAAYSVRCLWHPATSNDGRRRAERDGARECVFLSGARPVLAVGGRGTEGARVWHDAGRRPAGLCPAGAGPRWVEPRRVSRAAGAARVVAGAAVVAPRSAAALRAARAFF